MPTKLAAGAIILLCLGSIALGDQHPTLAALVMAIVVVLAIFRLIT